MSRYSRSIEPLCYTSDGERLYAIARGYIKNGDYSGPEFFVVRSNPHPASLDNLVWETISSGTASPLIDIQRMVYSRTALCGWSPTSFSFAMTNGLRLGSHSERIALELLSHRVSSSLSFDEVHTEDSTAQGRSLLLPFTSQTDLQGNGKPLSWWVQIDLESRTKEMLFTFYPDMDNIYQPRVRWSMDKFGSNEPPSTVYRLLASSNGIIYALGSSDDGLVMSTFPQNISSVAPYTTRPAQKSITTAHTPGLGLDCSLESDRTRMTTDNAGIIYLMCYPSWKNHTDMKTYTYKVYKFDGTKFHSLPPIPAQILSTSRSNAPFFLPVPNKDATQPATWAIVSLGDGESQLYNLTGKTPVDNHTLLNPKIFTTDRPYTFQSTATDSEGSGFMKNFTTFGMLLGVALFGLFISLYGMFVYRRNQRAEAQRALEGVNRVAYGDDACDSLPMYTPRAHTANHSGFYEALFHGRVTRPPSYKTTISVNGLSRSATRATMLASPTESATELELGMGVSVYENGTESMEGAVAAPAISESTAPETSEITVTTSSTAASTETPADSITLTSAAMPTAPSTITAPAATLSIDSITTVPTVPTESTEPSTSVLNSSSNGGS